MPISNIKFGHSKDVAAHTYLEDSSTMYLDTAKGSPMNKRQEGGRSFQRGTQERKNRSIARVITHEEVHHTVNRLAGSRASYQTDNPMVEKAVDSSCSNCGRHATHRHGIHGCCGSRTCHNNLISTHGWAIMAGDTMGMGKPFNGPSILTRRYKDFGW